jgi:hypothetical protein
MFTRLAVVERGPAEQLCLMQSLVPVLMQLDGLPTRDELMALKDQMWNYTNTRCNEMEGRLKAGFDAEIRRLEHKMELMQEQLQAGGGGSAEGLDGF